MDTNHYGALFIRVLRTIPNDTNNYKILKKSGPKQLGTPNLLGSLSNRTLRTMTNEDINQYGTLKTVPKRTPYDTNHYKILKSSRAHTNRDTNPYGSPI